MPETILKHSLRTAATLGAFAIVGTLLLALTHQFTREPIRQSEAQARLALFHQILPPTTHDNDLLQSAVKIQADALLGTSEAGLAYQARLQQRVVAVILEAIAPDGYSGDIKLLIAIRADGSVAGVRALAHKETPGLGDYIDAERSDWIRSFDGQSLRKLPAAGWKVKKDGGQFDYMAGATITPRAVIKAVRRALEYFDAHRASLLDPAATESDGRHE